MLFGARLYDYKARVYDPAYGHFLQTDPIGSKDDLDLYAYTADDPVNHGDPTGLETGNFSNGNMSAGVTGDLPDQWQKHPLTVIAGSVAFGGPLAFGAAGAAGGPTGIYLIASNPGTGLTLGGIVSAIKGAFDGSTVDEAPTAATGGRLGSAQTRAQVSSVADIMENRGWTITHGGGRGPEEYIPGAGGGTKGSSYPDITATKGNNTLRVNTADTRADGVAPTNREAVNAARIRTQTNGHVLVIPKKRQPND